MKFLIITHRKETMEAADTVYGVTMEEKGISKLLSMKLHPWGMKWMKWIYLLMLLQMRLIV